MNRRKLLQIFGAAFVVASGSALAQASRKPARVAVLSSTNPEIRSTFWQAFKDEMTKLGWVEGRDVVYIYRYTRGDSTRFDALAGELVAEKPDLIFTGSLGAALAAKRATREIPIVFGYINDPVGSGLVASLARPGGNVTGFSGQGTELSGKYIELLREIQPGLRRVSFLTTSLGTPSSAAMFKQVEQAGRAMRVEVEAIEVTGLDRISEAFNTLARKRPDGVVVNTTPTLLTELSQIAERMTSLRIPAVYTLAEAVVAGGLMSYAAQLADNYRRAASYVDRILKGAKPADLPVQQPVAFALVVNLKTAKAQGIRIPQSVLLRADRVIE